jgi:hypothetical protein
MNQDPETLTDPEAAESAQTGIITDDVTANNMAGVRSFEGKPLQAWTAFRQAAAERVGLRFGRIPADEIQSFRSNGMYDGIFADAVIVVWLCLQPQAKVLRAYRLPDEALTEAMNWAEKSGIHYPSDKAGELAALFISIVADVSAVQGQYKTQHESLAPVKRKGNSSRRRG